MATKLTVEQFEKINDNLIVDTDGKTNKRCPLCDGDIIVEKISTCHSIKCNNNCFSIDCRGL